MKRTSVSKSLRFEVFKRDSFTCQYCGQKSPDVVLEADHIHPVAKGGTNDLLNLITACKACNSGKSDRKLDDSSVIEKQRKQLAELQERKEQIEMMFQWHKGLLELDDHVLDQLSQFWSELVSYSLTATGKQSLKKLLKQHTFDEVMTGMKTSVDQYVEFNDGVATQDSVEKAWKYVGKICFVSKAEIEKPYLRDLLYIRGILRKRLSYTDERVALQLLEEAYSMDASVDSMREFSKTAKNWTSWRAGMEDYIRDQTSKVDNKNYLAEAVEEVIEDEVTPLDYDVSKSREAYLELSQSSTDNNPTAVDDNSASVPTFSLNRVQSRAQKKKQASQASRKKRF